MRDPRVVEFMRKVSFATHPQYCLAMLEEPARQMAKVEITTKDGKKFEEERSEVDPIIRTG